jgi:uncharacterized protein
MPNNNPQGRNQYTKHREQIPQAAGAGEHPSDGAAEHTDSADLAPQTPTDTSPSMGSMASAGNPSHTPAKRGFAAMDEATQRTIASKGGQSQGKENNPGNFANDRDRAREAGRKGGEAHGHRQQ